LKFYTGVLGFLKKTGDPMGAARWLTVVSPEAPDGPSCSWSRTGTRQSGPSKRALLADGIPFTSFAVENVRAEHERLQSAGVRFTQPPVEMGPVTTAVLDDTCGNLIQIAQKKR